jgi:hypothetical protein
MMSQIRLYGLEAEGKVSNSHNSSRLVCQVSRKTSCSDGVTDGFTVDHPPGWSLISKMISPPFTICSCRIFGSRNGWPLMETPFTYGFSGAPFDEMTRVRFSEPGRWMVTFSKNGLQGQNQRK